MNAEPIWNTYETLIYYNGSSTVPTPNGFVPGAATCVPGSAECLSQYGNTLVYPNATTGAPQYYTFELDAGAQFYDPTTGAHWGLYPSDVVFSLARTMAFANLPGFGVYNGWINTQDLLAQGNVAWDSGIHYPYNNTPANVLSAFLVNDSTYCPSPANPAIKTNGCVTFNVGASGLAWPYFLELVADPMGASVTPCGAFQYLGATVPGFPTSKAPHGDGPCLLPGNQTTTNAAYFSAINAIPATAWDALEELGTTDYPSPQAGVQFTIVGSGPYYEVGGTINPSVGYFLKANPYYVAPEGCAGQAGCLPEPGAYQPNVNVYWESGDTLSIQEAIAGQTDMPEYFPAETSSILQLVNEGKYGMVTGIPTYSIFFFPFALNWSLAAEATIDPVGGINIPTDFYSNVGLRQFLIGAWPYSTWQNSLNAPDGVHYGENYVGFIPHNFGSYYPANISGPQSDPTASPSTPGNLSWWWNELTTTGTPWYDSELTSCTSASPCKFPVFIAEGDTAENDAVDVYISEVTTFSDSRLIPYLADIPGGTLASEVGATAGKGGMPFYQYGWAPDYPDPTDYVNPVFQANNTYTTVDAVYQVLALPQYNAAACAADAGNLAYWANLGQIPNDCQGTAYQTMLTFMAQAAHMTNITQRTLLYNMLDHVGEELGLYIWWDQEILVQVYGSWINPATIGSSPMIQGGQDFLWYNFQYVTASFTVSFHETGLTSGTAWSVTMSTVSSPSTTAYANFTSQANGTYSWQAAYVAGYTLSVASGTLKVAGANVTVDLTYTPITTTTYTLTINEAGLVSGTAWSVIVNGVGTQWGNTSQFTYSLPAGTYAVYGGFVVAYNNSSAVQSVTISTAGVATTLVYTGTVFSTFSVTFVPVNLPGSQMWNVTLNGWTNSSVGGSIVFWEAAGSYLLVVTTGTPTVAPTFATGTVTVAANMTVTEPMVTAAHPGYALTFTETGLPAGSAWTLTIGGFSNTSTSTSNAFTAPNGTYNWTVTTIGGYTTTTWSGSAVVNGTATSVTIKFVQFTYPVTFFEGGLPTGTSWSVTAGGQTVSSTSYFLTIDLPNGTASFTVGTVTGFIATPASGTVTVTAGPATQVIIFGTVPTLYSVTFTETGLPTGGSWTVYLNGQSSGSTSGSTVTFSVVNGTYTFTVVPPSGYTASTALTGNTITVSGKAVSVAVTFAVTSTSTSTTVNNNNYIGTTAWAIIGVVIVLALIFLILALYFARRKPPMASPPQTWSGTPPTNMGDNPPPPSPPSS